MAQQTMEEVIRHYGDWAHGGEPTKIIHEWEVARFTPDEADEWLAAGVFTAEAARTLADANVTPELAAKVADEEIGFGYCATIGYKLANNDVSLAEALNFIWPDKAKATE